MGLQRHPVLVLNKLWMAVNVITLRRAMTLLFKEKAKVVLPDQNFETFTWEDWALLRPTEGEDFIKSIRMKFKIPEVIVLDEYDKSPAHKVKFSRRAIYKRDNYTCQYCGGQPGPPELNVDHVIPRSQGGQTTWENCVLSCVTCNSRKDNKTPEQAHMKLRSKPVKPKFCPFKMERKVAPRSWKHFVDFMYWNVELENENK